MSGPGAITAGSSRHRPSTVIIGAGPAGLSAAYRLVGKHVPVKVFEAHPTLVGGISRTEVFQGHGIDIGGHRFFSKSRTVEDFWSELLPHDMRDVQRTSSILYNGRFLSYPLRPIEALLGLGIHEAIQCGLSFAKVRLLPRRELRTFEDWVQYQFGEHLYELFFKTYTEKVWGIPCSQISADWAVQRIQRLSLGKLVVATLSRSLRTPNDGAVIKTLIDRFRYPRHGPGMLWEACARRVREQGGSVELGTRVVALECDAAAGEWRVTTEREGERRTHRAERIISTAPMTELIAMLRPEASEKARAAARRLRYRDFLIVALILKERGVLHQQWVYVHDANIKIGRIQNFKAWSADMVPDPQYCCYGLEHFCNEGDETWRLSDSAMIAHASREVCKILPVREDDIVGGHVIRQKKAYPVYDPDYGKHVGVVRQHLEDRYPGLHLVGRNGMHRYNNQDHSVMTGFLCADNILEGRAKYDVWRVNEDASYLEEGEADGGKDILWAHAAREAPGRLMPAPIPVHGSPLP
jgi:protoporphyrinogen oxidase